MDTYYCPNGCGTIDKDDLGKRVGGKIGGALAGAAVGGATRDPGLVLLGALAGAFVGHILDEQVLPTCPECQAILQVIDIGFGFA